ncbi:PKD domain-containing protein [Streptomyces sviceus]|uniref:PKD domain-containing protein n=1 Tax=Streptomyces sviceus TaxID=285530 RepID=UPI00331F6483
MSRMRLLAISAVVLSVLTGSLGIAAANVGTGTALYVDDDAAGCSDTGPGSQAVPFCQIQPAADAAAPGDTVYVARNKTGYAPVTIRSVGTGDEPVAFVTDAGDNSQAVGAHVLSSTATPAMTFSGAQYVDLTGFSLSSIGTSTLVVSRSQHIGFDMGAVNTAQAGPSTAETISVDGSSSAISLTRLSIAPESGGLAFASAAGAQDITLADDVTQLGGGISAVGTTGIHLAGDTIRSVCGNAISLSDGSSGSLENTVVLPDSATCSATGTPAEITVDTSSAPQVTADYNAVDPLPTGTDYDWAGTAYATSQAFRTGTGQGTHDLDQTDVSLSTTSGLPSESSPLIDSADADAPGELSTDLHGAQRVDDPLVTATGTGTGTYDRGAVEFQDPLGLGTAGRSSQAVYVGVPVTFSASLVNPWSDSVDGYSYTFDFGDGTTATSTTGKATHTYTQPTTSTNIYATVTVYRPDGTKLGREVSYFSVTPVPPLTGNLTCAAGPALPDTAVCHFDASGYSGYPITGDRISFGDGSAAVSVTGSKGYAQHTYATAGTYTVTQQLTDSDGRTATDTTRTTVGPAYVAVSPKRILDTRNGTGAAKRRVGPGGVVRLKVLGTGGVPASGVTAVTMNVTDADATASSYVTVYPDGKSRPTASNLDFTAGRTNPNLVTVRVSAGGYVDLYNAHGDVDLIADVQGYFTTKSITANDQMGNLAAIPPARVLDTRYGTGSAKGKVAPGSTTTVTLPKEGQTDETIGAVLNVTATGGTGSGVVTVYCDSRPSTSNLNYRAGQTVSNLVVTKVCSDGKIEIHNTGGHVNLIADLQGLYTDYNADGDNAPVGSPFVPAAPSRFLDTRNGTGAPAKPLGAGSTLTVKVAGVAGVPDDATAVIVNLTGVSPTTATHLTAYGAGSLPNVSNDNLSTGETRPVLAVIPVDADGDIHIHNANGSLNVVADLEGYLG